MKPPFAFGAATFLSFFAICLLPIAYMVIPPIWSRGADKALLDNFFDARLLSLGTNSLLVAGGTAAACLFAGAAFAFLAFRTDIAWRKWLRYAFVLPILIPPYIHAIVWAHLSRTLSSLHLDLHSIGGVIFVLTMSFFPFVSITTMAGLKSLDREQEEAAMLAGGKWTAVRRVTLPLCLPHILSGTVFVFVFSLVNLSVPDILRVKVYPLEIFIQFSAFYDNWTASALSLPMVAATLLLVILLHWRMKGRSYVQIGGGKKEALLFKLGKYRRPCAFFCLSMLGLSAATPIAVLAYKSGGFEIMARVLSTSTYAIGISLLTAMLGAFFTVFLGFCLAYWQHRLGGKKGLAISLLATAPFAIPATTMGIGLIGLWNRAGLDWVYGSMAMIVVAYAARFLPYAAAVMHSGMAQIGVQVEEAASLTGSSFFNTFFKIVIPLAGNHLVAGFFIVFILAFGELSTTLLISPPGVETAPVKIYNLMHCGAEDMVAALCIVILVLIFLMSGLFLLIQRKLGTWRSA